MCYCAVNIGDYIQAVCDRNNAENISRVLYPNDNVGFIQTANPNDAEIYISKSEQLLHS